MMTSYADLGKYLKVKRVQARLTQAELAAELKIHSQFVSNWERGLCAPPHHCFQTIIKRLKISKSELVEVMLKDSRRAIREKIFGKSKSSGKTAKA